MSDHPVFAAVYDRVGRAADRAGLRDRRRHLLASARGRVLEVGGGTGLNLLHYGAVDELVIIEPDGAMRRRLEERLGRARVPVQLLAAGIEDAPLAEGSFDTVVTTLVLCTVPDPAAALARIKWVLAPGGRLLFLEHIRDVGARRVLQRAANPVWRRLAAGCHLDRDTPAAMRDAGFVINSCQRFRVPMDPFSGAMIQGVATAAERGSA